MTRTRRTTTEIVALLRDSNGLPTTEQVNNHNISFFPRHWLNRWDESLPAVPSVLQDGKVDARGRQNITRSDLFSMGATVTRAQDAVNFYVAVCSWGAGSKARDIYRRIPTLSEPAVGEKLLEGILLARDPETPAKDAYQAFYATAQYRLKGLGPAFFTKLLYFAADPSDTRELRHLILDQKVAASIGWPNKVWWDTSEYVDYLELVNETMQQMPEAERSDCIEMRLFSL